MSTRAYQADSDCDGEVDFDFFDEPKAPPSPGFSSKEPRNAPAESDSEHDSENATADSSSDSDSASGPVTRASVKKIEAKLPVLASESQDYSDSFESDSEGEKDLRKNVTKGEKKSDSRKQGSGVSQKKAWGTSEKQKSAPSKSQNRGRSKSNGETKQLSKPRSHKMDLRLLSDDSSDISTDSDTDSDVTEVSPLGSPRNGAGKDMYEMRQLAKLGKPPRSPMHKEAVSYHKPARPSSAKDKENKLDKLLNADSDSMDLQLLMQAVLEMEQDREKRQRQQRRVLFAPPPKAKPQAKLNQTFSNDKVRTIDRENQRLMQRIMTMAREADAVKTKTKKPKYATREPPKLTPSAVNRLSEQRRIERDNLAMLKRLQTTRATKDLQRDKLLTTYNSTMIAGHSVAEVHQQAGGRSKLRSPYESHSATSVTGGMEAGAAGTPGGKRTRPTSAKSAASTASTRSMRSGTSTRSTRPYSGKRASAGRPDWESGW